MNTLDKKKIISPKLSLEKLKLELALRSPNENCGSGLGGNSSELFFLLSKEINATSSNDDLCHFSNDGKNTITIMFPKVFNIKQCREELTNFFNLHCDRNNFTTEEITDVSFLKERVCSTETKLLLMAVETARELASRLNQKNLVLQKINALFEKEHSDIETLFLKEINYPIDYLNKLKGAPSFYDNPIQKMFCNHPVWSIKYKNINNRLDQIVKDLVSQEDIDKLEIIGTYPKYIVLLVNRTILGLEMMIRLCLDERVSFYATIYKLLE